LGGQRIYTQPINLVSQCFFEGAGLQSRAEHSREGRADTGVKIREKDYACLDFMKVCKTFFIIPLILNVKINAAIN